MYFALSVPVLARGGAGAGSGGPREIMLRKPSPSLAGRIISRPCAWTIGLIPLGMSHPCSAIANDPAAAAMLVPNAGAPDRSAMGRKRRMPYRRRRRSPPGQQPALPRSSIRAPGSRAVWSPTARLFWRLGSESKVAPRFLTWLDKAGACCPTYPTAVPQGPKCVSQARAS